MAYNLLHLSYNQLKTSVYPLYFSQIQSKDGLYSSYDEPYPSYDQTWPYVIVLYKYFTLTDKAMYLLQGRVSIKPINVTTK